MPSHYRSAIATNSKYFSKSWDFTKMISHRVVWWLFSLMKFNDPKILKCLEISLTSEITWSHYNNGNYHISSVINASRSPYKSNLVIIVVYQDSGPMASSASKGNSKFEILLVKIFSLKQNKWNTFPATLKKSIFFSSRKQPQVPSDYNF